MIYCPTPKDYNRLKLLLMAVPESLLDLLISRGLSIRVYKGEQRDLLNIYSKLRRQFLVSPPDNRLPHESAHYDPQSKQIVLFRRDLYSSYNVPMHELGHAVDFLGHSKISPLSSCEYVKKRISKTPHLNSYTRSMDEGRNALTEHFATCFSAYFSEQEDKEYYGHHYITQLNKTTIEYFQKEIAEQVENYNGSKKR